MGPPRVREIVGVVGDVRPTSLDSEAESEIFVPEAQAASGSMTFVVRARGHASLPLPRLEAAIWDADPEQVIYHSSTVPALVSATLATRRFNLVLLAVFSTVALLLVAVGIYGVVSFTTGQRMHEIGVRVALGARPRDVVVLIVRQGVRLDVPGVAIGMIAGAVLARLMVGMLYGVPALDPVTFLAVGTAMLGLSLAAALLPARRAAAVDPARSLRRE